MDTVLGIRKLPEAFRVKFKKSCKQSELLKTTLSFMLTLDFFVEMRKAVPVYLL
jgi:hypothetical protein